MDRIEPFNVELYTALIEADNAWMAAIAATFPKRHAGDVRYSSLGKGEPGSDLRAAFDRFESASVAYHDRAARRFVVAE